MDFKCVVIDTSGKRRTFTQTSATKEVLLLDLNRQGFTILSMEEARDAGSHKGKHKISRPSILDFTRTMHLLLSSGLGIKEALKIAVEIFEKDETLSFLKEVTATVEKGHTLFEALSPWGRSLGTLYLGLIKIGEKTSSLTPIFEKLTEYLMVQKTLRDKLINALIYPSLVLSVALGGVIFLVTFIFPALNNIVGSLKKDAGKELQSNILGFQDAMGLMGLIVLLLALVIGILVYQSRKSSNLRLGLSKFFWKLPFVGGGLQILEGLYFSFAMETLLQAGYSAEVSLSEASATLKNLYFKTAVDQAKNRVLQGISLSKSFHEDEGVPRRLITWIQVGERAGDLKQVFSQLRFYYQQDMEKATTRLMNLMEPLLILGVGVILILLILNFITPVFSMLGDLL